jgi:plastocyanin
LRKEALSGRRWPRLVLLVCLVSLILATFAMCARPTDAATTWTVKMHACEVPSFEPVMPTINVGDTVTWVDVEGYHTTTSVSGQAESWDSGPMVIGQSFSHTFTVPGTYRYMSRVDTGLSGTIVVTEPVPEFPDYFLALTLGLAVALALLLERRLRRSEGMTFSFNYMAGSA